ncbi:MAG: SPOR domain-containing protein [Ignavibacteriales bacterium]|nr:SPOR domain-containing protein [Ignavibacteriales bacterium]
MTRHILTYPVFPSRIFFCFILFIALHVVSAHAFQSRSVEVVPSSGTRVETAPGRLLTLSFRVTNTSSSRKRFESTVVTPSGWRRLARDFPFELEAGGSDIRLLSISIPAESPARDYTLRYGVKDPSNPSEAAEVTMTIAITGVKEQGLKLIESPRIAVAGEAYTSVFVLNNKGNVANVVRLLAHSSAGFPAVPDSAALHVGPGETRTIRVKVSTDPALTAKLQDILELTAELDTANTAKASSFVEVVPRVTGSEERYVRFPVRALIRFAGEQEKRGTQLELSGSGPLGNNEENRLDLLIRTPDIQQKSVLGRRDEYQLAYIGKSFEAFVGDKNFSLTPLTEYNRYGFGASGNVKVNRMSAGAFYNEARFFSPKQREWAGYLNYRVLDAAQVGLNYLGKQEPGSSSVVTIRTLAQPMNRSELELEYGMSSLSGQTDNAFSARWTGSANWLAYDTRYVRAGTKYGGYYKDVELKNISFNLMPLRDIRLEGFYRDEQRNLDHDTTLLLAPRDRYYQAGLSISNLLAVYYRTNDQDDLLPDPHFRRKEETWQVRVGYNLPAVTVIASADLGSTDDKIAGIKNPFQRYSSYLSLQPFSGQTYGFSAEYTKDRDPSTFEQQERLAGSFSVNLLLGEGTQFSLSIFGNRGWGAVEQSYTLLDVGFDHSFPWGHTVAFRGRQSIFSPSFEKKEIAWLVEYSVPIGVPIARSTVSGQLIGRVMDAEKGTGVRNVLVYAGGATALTDRNGDYNFPSLKPDKYFIQVDMTTVGLNRVTLQQLPHELTIVGGEESRFDVSLSRSVVVTGTVLMFGAKEQAANDTTQPAIVELGGHPNVIVELVSGDDVNRRVTDSRGRFAFSNIRPGRWTLRIADGNLPQNYYFDKEAVELNVAPGQSAEQTFKALPKRRRIQMISQGVTISTSPDKGKKTQPPVAKKIIEPVPQVAKPAEAAALKPKSVIPAPQTEIKNQTISPVQRAEKPAQMPCNVVFWPEKLIFCIEHSDWRKKSSADSVAAVLVPKSRLAVFVRTVVLPDGKLSYRVLLGGFKSRRAAENACEAVRDLK